MITTLPSKVPLHISFGISLLISLITFTGCHPSRKLMKDAQVLESGGLYSEAFVKYASIYQNYSSAEARVGMKRMAQQLLDTKSQKAQMLCMTESYDEALSAYDDAISFQKASVELELRTSQNLEDARAQCKSKYLLTLCGIAEKYVMNDDFENAHIYIRKIFALDRNSQKGKFLDAMCEILPNYNAGLSAMEKGLWRDAYVYFNEVCRVDADYKEALKLRDEAKEKGTYSIVYKISNNKNVPDDHEGALAAAIKGRLLHSDNPFIELLERDDLNVILQEQQETLTPEYEGESGAESGKLKRARFILSGEIALFDYTETPEIKTKCDCGSTFHIYSDKVNCYEITKSNSLKVTYRYKLLDSETGKLFNSDVISFSDGDDGKRFKYEIMKKVSLTSPTRMRDHDVDLSGLKVPEEDPLISEQDLEARMYAFIAEKVALAVNNFRP